MSSETEQLDVDLFDVHGESPKPLQTQNENYEQKSALPSSSVTIDECKTTTTTTTPTPTSLLPFKATEIIRSISDKIPHQINTFPSLTSSTPIIKVPNKMKPIISIESPVSSNASSPQPP
eukprot:768717_1